MKLELKGNLKSSFVLASKTRELGVDRIKIQRDLRIDLFRGFALLFVFIDHFSEIASAAGLYRAARLSASNA